ncbi:MAG: cellulose binding domain-containing protein, partial [Cyanobacteria bacterium P01_G01_bin.19]
MARTKISNSNLYSNSYVSQSWNGGYKLEVDLTSKSSVDDWTLDFDLSHTIRGAYGVDLVDNGNGNYTISGQGNLQDLDPGETAKAIFIIDSNTRNTTIPKFTASGSSIINKPDITEPKTIKQQINASSKVVEDWNGGYKLEVDISSESKTSDWTLDFELPYTIRGAYGVDLVDNGDGNYTISGQGGWQDLDPGETAKAIFIIDGNADKASIPKFTASGSSIINKPDITEPDITEPNITEPKTIKQQINASSKVVEDWNGGYKLEVDISSESKTSDWTLDFDLPYTIRGAYG